MVGDDLHGDGGLIAIGALLTGEHLHLLHDGREEVGVVVGVHVLHDACDTLKTHAGVDAGVGKRRKGAVFAALILHEDEVPDLKVAVAIAAHSACGAIAAILLTPVDVDLGTGTTGAGVAHGPEVVGLAQTHDAFFGHADLLVPDLKGFVVIQVDGDPEFVHGKLVAVGKEVPGKVDGVFFKVIAKGEVAQHLEKGVVTGGVAHVLQIVVLASGAHTLLAGGGGAVLTLLFTDKSALELHHTGVYKKQSGIVRRHQRRASQVPMVVLLKIVDKEFARFAAFHHHLHAGPLPGHVCSAFGGVAF